MRIEKRFLAYGNDLDTDIDPFQAGLEFALDWNSDFIGKSALLERRDQAPTGKLVSIVFDEIDARPLGNEPVRQAGRIIGKTTSAAFGYRLGKPVAIARLECKSENNLDGLKVDVDIARSQNAGTAFLNAAYDPRGSNMRASTR
jgi:4-methylaminobutanoate oxidase (formaldehyde-forming)